MVVPDREDLNQSLLRGQGGGDTGVGVKETSWRISENPHLGTTIVTKPLNN